MTHYTIDSWLKEAASHLESTGIPSFRLDAEILLAHTLRKPRTWLHAHLDDTLDARSIEIARARLDLRLDRVPIAYIIGHKEFYGYSFRVTTATLIPRPESESLIDLLAETPIKHVSHPKIVDVGTGSGALGITTKLLYPHADVTLVDISRYALAVAEKNTRDHKIVVEILESNLLESYASTADIIIANLPYVDESWHRSPETDHEPALALFADANGLALINTLIGQTRTKLSNGGYIILEADPEQHPLIKKEAEQSGLLLVKIDGYGMLFQKIK